MRKIVQAAFKCNDGKVYGTGPFHDLNQLIEGLEIVTEGFIVDAGEYLTREEITKSENAPHLIQSEEVLGSDLNNELTFKLLLRNWFRERGIKFFKSELWTLIHDSYDDNKKENGLDVDETAYFMSGDAIEDSAEFRAAKFLSGEKELDADLLRYALIMYETDLVAAALHAYNFDVNEENRDAIKAVIRIECNGLNKSEIDVAAIPRVVDPFDQRSQFMAAAVRRSFSSRRVFSVSFKGKHSKGMGVAEDPKTHDFYLLKPGSGNLSPAAGVKDIDASQSERETAFQKVAELVGLGQFFVNTELLLVDGEQVAGMDLLPKDYKSISHFIQPSQKLETYRQSGQLFQWAILDYLLGNPDRHSGNILMNETNDLKLIDHGSAFAGENFSPGVDPKSFVPYYLRCFSSDNFLKLTPVQRMHIFPKPPLGININVGDWVTAIDSVKVTEILTHYNIDTKSFLARLSIILAVPSNGRVEFVLDTWAGL